MAFLKRCGSFSTLDALSGAVFRRLEELVAHALPGSAQTVMKWDAFGRSAACPHFAVVVVRMSAPAGGRRPCGRMGTRRVDESTNDLESTPFLGVARHRSSK